MFGAELGFAAVEGLRQEWLGLLITGLSDSQF